MTCDAYEHITRIAVEVKDVDLLPLIADQLGWQYREQANVANCSGPGLLPMGWRYPIVIQDGQVAFADFQTSEGNKEEVARLKARYTLEEAKKAAASQGYEYDENGDEVIIYQPAGVVVTVRGDGSLEINRLDLVEGDPTLYLQESLGTVIESAFHEHHSAEAHQSVQQYS